MKHVVIAGYCRSPFTPAHKGQLSTVRPDDLAAQVVKGLIRKTGVDPHDIEDLDPGLCLSRRRARTECGASGGAFGRPADHCGRHDG